MAIESPRPPYTSNPANPLRSGKTMSDRANAIAGLVSSGAEPGEIVQTLYRDLEEVGKKAVTFSNLQKLAQTGMAGVYKGLLGSLKLLDYKA